MHLGLFFSLNNILSKAEIEDTDHFTVTDAVIWQSDQGTGSCGEKERDLGKLKKKKNYIKHTCHS